MMATSSSGVLMENVEEAQQGKQDLMMQEMLTNQIADSEQQALEDLQGTLFAQVSYLVLLCYFRLMMNSF